MLDDTAIEVPEGWYSTTAFTDYAVKFIDEGVSTDKPFFLYLAYTAPHWPLQAPEDVTTEFLSRYSKGWLPHREARFTRQMEVGMFPKSTKLAPLDPKTPDWESVENRLEMDLRMAIHAAMVHLIEKSIGRVVARLKELGELDNTLILFLTDNGASAESGATGFVRSDRGNPKAKTGRPDSYVSFGIAEANMCNTPSRKYKMYLHEGGIATPLVAHWPKGISANRNGTLANDVVHVIDLLPTCLDLAGTDYPSQHDGKALTPVAGICG